MQKIYLISATIFYCFTSLCWADNTLQNKSSFIGKAYNPKTNNFVYEEQHRYETSQDGQKVMHSTFTDSAGNTIAERTVTYQNGQVNAYQLTQNKINYQESAIRQNDTIQLEGQKGDTVKIKELTNKSNNLVIDAGFSDYIVRNWEQLEEGELLKFDFVSISRMDTLRLQVKMVELEKTSADEYFSDQEVTAFQMTVAHPVFKMLIKPIEIAFYKNSKQLAYYKGISNLKDSDGKQFSSVRIKYSNQRDTS